MQKSQVSQVSDDVTILQAQIRSLQASLVEERKLRESAQAERDEIKRKCAVSEADLAKILRLSKCANIRFVETDETGRYVKLFNMPEPRLVDSFVNCDPFR